MDRKVEVNINGIQIVKSISSNSYCIVILVSYDKMRNSTIGYIIHKLPTSSDRWCCCWTRMRKRRGGKQVVSCTAGEGAVPHAGAACGGKRVSEQDVS